MTGENIMRTGLRLAVLAAALAFGTPSWAAGDFDGSTPLICAPVEVMDCTTGMRCVTGQPGELGAPDFMRVDFAAKAVIGPERTSPIRHMDDKDGQWLLQGTELGFGWTMAIHQETGRMSLSLVDRNGVFVLLGPCAPL